MDYAIQMLVLILGGLLLGYWLSQRFGISPIWTIVLGFLGMAGGFMIVYKRFTYPELYGDKKLPRWTGKKKEGPADADADPSGTEGGKHYHSLTDVLKESDWDDEDDDKD